jgi:hypothetical protein
MRFWHNGSALLLLCGGILALAHVLSFASQLDPRRRNELTLGRLRPGKDTIEEAKNLYKDGQLGRDPLPDPLIWEAFSARARTTLRFEANAQHIIRVITASHRMAVLESLGRPQFQSPVFHIAKIRAANNVHAEMWKTGLGLGLDDSCRKTIKLYGEPNSRSPSTTGGQQLESLHYAFDWAGPDVPQGMEVLCTPEKDGKPGRVVEITLAALSL